MLYINDKAEEGNVHFFIPKVATILLSALRFYNVLHNFFG
jgi:hypothetical protein